AGVPTMYWGLLHHDLSTSELSVEDVQKKLRTCVSGGAALPVQVLEEFEAKFDVPILEGYGMSEGSPVVTFNHMGSVRKPGSIGTPVWGVDVKVVDENDKELPVGEKGELLYRGHNVMKGYYKKPGINQVVLRGGWMHSGDVAIKDEDGYFFIVDRTKDMVIRGGLNVYPREVEEVMIQHDEISLVAVIGIPDEKLGEEIKAYVVLHEGAQSTESEIIEWIKAKIAAYKYPRHVEFVKSLPMSATGKILKRELRKQIETKAS
ncbi:MAG: AMP-binding protein, partial [Saprospiraceae bacterium]|nr:AMP-binding protein [Saprospiraceae bacterium]